VTRVHDGVRSKVVDTVELWRALGSKESRGRAGPMLIHLHGYVRRVTTDIIGPSLHREAARIGENMVVAWEACGFGEAEHD